MKPKFKFTKKGVIIGSIIGLVTLLSTAPSYAFSIDDFFKVLGKFNNYFEETKNELTAAANEWGGMKGEAKTAIQTGSMDMPDPVNSAEKLKEQLKSKGNWNESNTVEGAVGAANELERETTRATIASVLGEVGQERTKNEIEATEQTVAEAKELAESAQAIDISENSQSLCVARL